MQFTLKHITDIVQGSWVQRGLDEKVTVKHFTTDSRKIRKAAQSMFVCLKTEVRDGHSFIASSYAQGVRCFLVSASSISFDNFPEANFILVKDTLHALQDLVRAHRKAFDIPVYGITGSNGKTIVKEWLAQLLGEDMHVLKNPKSYNSQIGVAYSVAALKKQNELAIFEAGISKPNEMDRLERIIQPTHGIFTMIGAAHDINFESTKQKIEEKLQLFVHTKKLFYCLDHDEIHEAVLNFVKEKNPNLQLCTWGEHATADLQIEQRLHTKLETILRLKFKGKAFEFKLPYTDSAYVENAMHCLLVLLDLGFSTEQLSDGFAKLKPVKMRLELLKGIQDCTLINDTYSSDLASLRIALDFLYEQKQHQEFSLILSDILQHAKSNDVYQEVIELLSMRKLKTLVLIGSKVKVKLPLFDAVAEHIYHFSDVPDFLNEFNMQVFHQEALLIKGAREYMLERIVNRLEKNIHRTVMNINLTALVNNVNAFKKILKPKTKIMAMVKAFSYGSGSYEIAQTLEHHGVDYLAVAYVDEGILLRKNGIQLPILVLNPELTSLDAMLHYDLEPEIYSLALLKQFGQRLQDASLRLKIHIKLDTGMHRLGIEQKDLTEFLEYLLAKDCFKVKSVFSHLAGSDAEHLSLFTKEQKEHFIRMSSQIENSLDYNILKHLANSAGAIQEDDLQFDMVRLGLGLYGISKDENIKIELQQISTLKTNISQIKQVSKNDTVGYGRAGVLKRDSLIATLNIGYADGYARQFSQGKGKVLIHNKLAPVIGNVCMDMIMVDITDIPDVIEGQEAIIFGDGLCVTELAQWIDTIPYEIISGISRRVKRVFFRE